MTHQFTSPSIDFFQSYKSDILASRDSLFKELDNISPTFGNEARKILEKKLQLNNNPLMGELFPWLIADLVESNRFTTHKISVGWLSIYLYTLFLDEYVDNPKPLSTEKFITGSLLAKTGLLKIAHYTCNTPFEGFVENALTYSAINQQLDVKYQKKHKERNFKEKYSEGKNYIVLACAGALAAENSKHSDFIIEFTKKLLLTFQYLDDICDYYEDFKNNNLTVLLDDAFNDLPSYHKLNESYSKNQILSQLVESGSLQRVIEKIICLLEQSFYIINEKNFEFESPKKSILFFNKLKTQCQELNKYLSKYQPDFKFLPKTQQYSILDNVEKHLRIIAQGT